MTPLAEIGSTANDEEPGFPQIVAASAVRSSQKTRRKFDPEFREGAIAL
jgi:hypothetical protein